MTRILFPLILIFATYNPVGHSIIAFLWTAQAPTSVLFFVGFALFLVWLIIVRVSLMGLGVGGILISTCVVLVLAVAAVAFVSSQEVELALDGRDNLPLTIIGVEILLSLFLSFGLMFSYWVRQVTGQSAIIKNPP